MKSLLTQANSRLTLHSLTAVKRAVCYVMTTAASTLIINKRSPS